MVDSWSRALDQNEMYPDRDKLSNVPRSGYITARDQSVVESGVTDDGKNTTNFLFCEGTQQHKQETLKLKSNDF